MRGTTLTLVCALITSLSCASSNGDAKPGSQAKRSEKRDGKIVKTVDGLVKRKVDMPGVLFIRPEHAIGSYDAFLISPVSVNYDRKSRHLNADMEEDFKVQLHDALVESATAANIPIVTEPGACTMQIGLSLQDIQLKRSHSTSTLGRMTLVMEFRDSVSRQALLRFATINQIKNQERSGSRSRMLRKGFDEMLGRMNVGKALVEAGLSDNAKRPGCTGLLAQRVEPATPAVSAR